MDDDEEAVSQLNQLWNQILSLYSKADFEATSSVVHIFATRFLHHFLNGRITHTDSWFKCISILSHMLVDRIRLTDNVLKDTCCWKLICLVKLIGVHNLPFKSELLKYIEEIWKKYIEPLEFSEEEIDTPFLFPSLVDTSLCSLKTLVDSSLPTRTRSPLQRIQSDNRSRRKSLTKTNKKDIAIGNQGDQKPPVYESTSSEEDVGEGVIGPVVRSPIYFEDRSPDVDDVISELDSSGKLSISDDERLLFETVLPPRDFSSLLLDILSCFCRAEPHFGRIVFYRSKFVPHLRYSLRLLLMQVFKEKTDSLNIEWLTSLLEMYRCHNDIVFQEECITVLLTSAFHLVNSCTTKFKANLLTVLVRITELDDDAITTEKQCSILCDVAIGLKHLRLRSSKHTDVFHHSDRYGVPYGSNTGPHICVVARICERLIRLTPKFYMGALQELKRVAYCCCFSPVVPLLELFETSLYGETERLCILDALETYQKRSGGCRVCDSKNNNGFAAYAKTLFNSRNKSLSNHLATVAALKNAEAHLELYNKIVLPAFTFLAIEDLPLIFPLLAALFDTLPHLCKKFFDQPEYVETLASFIYSSSSTNQAVSLRLYETIMVNSPVALTSFLNIIEDEMHNYLQGHSESVLVLLNRLLDALQRSGVIVDKEGAIRERHSYLDTSHRLLLTLIADVHTNTAFQICDNILSMLLKLCPLQLWTSNDNQLTISALCSEIYKAIPKDRETYTKISLLLTTNIHNKCSGYIITDWRFCDDQTDDRQAKAEAFDKSLSLEQMCLEEPEGYEADSESCSVDLCGKQDTSSTMHVGSCYIYADMVGLCLDVICFVMKSNAVASNSLTAAIRQLSIMCMQNRKLLGILTEHGAISRISRSYLNGQERFLQTAEVTEAMLYLIQLLAKHSIQSDELFDLLQLFKMEQPPYELLLELFRQLLSLNPGPPRVLAFSSVTDEDIDRSNQTWLSKMKMQFYDMEGPWSSKGAIIALPLSAVFEFDNVAFSAWFHVHKKHQEEKSSADNDASKVHIVSLGNKNALIEVWYNPVSQEVVIRLSQCRPLYEVSWRKSLKLPDPEARISSSWVNSWHHIFVEVSSHNRLSVSINGQRLDYDSLPIRSLNNVEVTLMGSQCFPMKLASLMVFKGVERGEHAHTLYHLGPMFCNLVECPITTESWYNKQIQEYLKPLQKNITYAYLPTVANKFVTYPRPSKFNSFFTNIRQSQLAPVEQDVFFFTTEPCVRLATPQFVHTSLVSLGGYQVLLFLFAWIIERSDNSDYHAEALDIVFKAAAADRSTMTEFIREGMGLLNVVLQNDKCPLTLKMLKVCLAHCCDLTEGKLVRPEILVQVVFSVWPKWQSDSIDCLSDFLNMLVRPKNKHHAYNVQFIVRLNGVDKLLNILKLDNEKSNRSSDCRINPGIAKRLLHFIDSVVRINGYPHNLLSSLLDFIVLYHNATLTYVVHQRTSRVEWSNEELTPTKIVPTMTADGEQFLEVTDSSISDDNGNPPAVVPDPSSPTRESPMKRGEDSLSSDEDDSVKQEEADQGMYLFVCGIYNIFCDVIKLNSSITLPTLKADLLLVLANEPTCAVRVSVVQCLYEILRHDSEAQLNFLRLNGYHLLSNQLSQYKCNEALLVALVRLCSGVYLESLDKDPVITEGFKVWPDAAIPLMTCIPRCASPAICARYITVLSQVVAMCPRLAHGLVDNNIIEQICDLLPYVNSSISKALYDLVYVIVIFQEKSRSSFVIQFYLRLYTLYSNYLHKEPGSRAVKYIPRLYSALLQGYSDTLEYNISLHITANTSPVHRSPEVYFESMVSSVTDEDAKNGGKGLKVDYPPEWARKKVSQSDLDTSLLLLVELFQYSRPSVLLCKEGFLCLERIVAILASCCAQKTLPSVNTSANYQISNLTLALLRPTLDIDQRVRCAAILTQLSRLDLLVRNMAANKLQILCGFVHELYEGSKHDVHAKNLLDVIKNSLHIESGYYCEMKRQGWLAQFDSDRQSFLEHRGSAALTSDQFVASKVNLDLQNVKDAAMRVTRIVVDFQNSVRKQYFSAFKSIKCIENNLKLKWKTIAQRLTHERAVWHMPEFVPAFWELDPTEGPSRIRKRLRRAHLELDSRFWMDESCSLPPYKPPLSYLYWSNVQPDKRLYSMEQIRSVYTCSMITASVETKGEVLIGLESVRFVPEDGHQGSQTWSFNTITEIMLRRYEHVDVAVEMFLNSGLTCLLIFETSSNREDFYEKLVPNCQKLQKSEPLSAVTARWQKRQITNFEYLTILNKMAGRSFNNLMQYPVFPFILSQYDSDELDLTDPRSFRILERPIAVQDKTLECHYIENYRQSAENLSLSVVSGPFHYGSHYSNSGIVLHFLVRVPPFTQAFLSYQDDSFDIPDRTFHSLETTWRLASRDSPTDVKELIPEFFYFPEFLRNIFKFDFGIRQTGERVNDVRLPRWCENDARLFNLINLAALECDYITEKLNNWIDLVFGYKQQGKYAVDAINVFHPATYAQNIATDQMDSISLKAYKTMIKTYGQMPFQLFTSAHPNVNLNATSTIQYLRMGQRVLPSVCGIRWGSYVGSPDDPDNPECIWSKSFSVDSFGSLIVIDSTKIVGVPPFTDLYNDAITTALLSWNHCDRVVRIKLKKDAPLLPLIDCAKDPVSFIRCVQGRNEIFVGHTSGIIWVYKMTILPSICALHSDTLIGHKSNVLYIDVCPEYFIVASTSSDGSVILWDLNSLKYVRTVLQVNESLTCVKMSPTLGDAAIVQDVTGGGSKLHLYTINGVFVAQLETHVKITCVQYSTAPDGASVNVILTGHEDGTFRLYSSWNLVLLREIQTKLRYPIVHAVYSKCNQFLFACDSSGQVCAWGRGSRNTNNNNTGLTPPKFLQEKM